jgi:uncharacterized membrane protein
MIQVYRNGQLTGLPAAPACAYPHADRPNAAQAGEPKRYKLSAGKQLFDDFPQRIDTEGTYKYKVIITAESDTIKENNTAYGLVVVQGKPKVLYVESKQLQLKPGLNLSPSASSNVAMTALQTVLTQNRIDVKVIQPKQMPNTLIGLQSYDAIIFNNVSSDDIASEDKMKLIETYVRNLGKGFIMIGGDKSFGRGGYFDTPIERVLPVFMSPQKKQSLALILLLDKSGSMANLSVGVQKMEIALRAARSVIEMEMLKKRDVIGVIAFDAQTKSRIIKITDLDSKKNLSDWVSRLRAGSGTNMYKALEEAYERLKNIEAKQKIVVVLSDGKSDGDFVPLTKRMAADKITISTIAIGDAARGLMEEIATVGKGHYRYVADISQLPKILVEEVRRTQELMIEEEFQPRIVSAHEILTGITSVPKLKGYIATSEKEQADVPILSPQGHPILAAWRYGLGRSIAFTSDVEPRWAVEWIKWDKFGKFWTQAVNWVLPNSMPEYYDLTVSLAQGKALVTLETFNESGKGGQIEFNGRATAPDETGQSLDFRQTAPNRYEALFDVNQTGAYLITVNKIKDGQTVSQQNTSLVVSYSPEFATIESNIVLLRQLADDSNGIFNPTPKQIGYHTGAPTEIFKALWGLFALCAALLFPLELAIRRLQLPKSQLANLLEKIPTIGSRMTEGERRKEYTKSSLNSEISAPNSDVPLTMRLLEAKKRSSQ